MQTFAVRFRCIKNLRGALHQHITKSKGKEKHLLIYYTVIYVPELIHS